MEYDGNYHGNRRRDENYTEEFRYGLFRCLIIINETEVRGSLDLHTSKRSNIFGVFTVRNSPSGLIGNKDHFKDSNPNVRWRETLEHAEKIGIGSRDYELIKM